MAQSSLLIVFPLQDGTSATVLHAGTTSTHSYEDEGYVQIYEVSTKPLASSQKVYVAIWAVNGVRWFLF